MAELNKGIKVNYTMRGITAEDFFRIRTKEIYDTARPRHERRQEEAQLKKEINFINSLSDWQFSLINEIIKQSLFKEGIRFTKLMDNYNDMMDRCICAYLYLNYSYSVEEAQAEEDKIAELITDDYKKFKDLEEFNMGKDVDFEALNKKCEELISEKATQSHAVKSLVEAFPEVSKSILVCQYKKLKNMASQKLQAEAKKMEKEEIKNAVNYIFSEDNSADEKKPEKKICTCNEPEEMPAPDTKAAEAEAGVEDKPNIPNTKKKLKIKKVEFSGEYGTYLVNNDGVTLMEENLTFKNADEVKAYRDKKIEELDDRLSEFLEALDY